MVCYREIWIFLSVGSSRNGSIEVHLIAHVLKGYRIMKAVGYAKPNGVVRL